VNGVDTLLFGILVWVQWSEFTLWLIGTLVAIDMLLNGVWLVMLALNVRGLSPQEIQERMTGQSKGFFEQRSTRQSGRA